MANIDRISTYGAFQTTLGHISRADANLADLQNQLSSGHKTQNFSGISGQAAQFMQLDDKMARNNQYLQNISLVKTRVDTTSNIMGQVITTATNFGNTIALRRNASLNDGGAFQVNLETTWKTLVGQLNTTVDGYHIFGGSRGDVEPVNPDDFPTLVDSPNPDNKYYQGDQADLKVRLADDVEITYNARADASGFQKIFAALSVARTADLNNDQESLGRAYQLVQAGLDELIGQQAIANTNVVTLNTHTQNITSLNTYWKGVKEEIINTDIIAASTQVAIDQGILQATFQAFARISSLRLVDFLR